MKCFNLQQGRVCNLFAHAESFNKPKPTLAVKLKKPSRLIGIPQFYLLPFYFFPKLENTQAIDKSLNWQLRLPRQNATGKLPLMSLNSREL
jgi:hypothetical protein